MKAAADTEVLPDKHRKSQMTKVKKKKEKKREEEIRPALKWQHDK